jgi:hypothetical protein
MLEGASTCTASGVDSEPLFRITHVPAVALHGTWAPGGAQIALARQTDQDRKLPSFRIPDPWIVAKIDVRMGESAAALAAAPLSPPLKRLQRCSDAVLSDLRPWRGQVNSPELG